MKKKPSCKSTFLHSRAQLDMGGHRARLMGGGAIPIGVTVFFLLYDIFSQPVFFIQPTGVFPPSKPASIACTELQKKRKKSPPFGIF